MRHFLFVVIAAGIIAGIFTDQSFSLPANELEIYAEEAEVACLASGHALPPKPFTTDGCSLFPNGRWVKACITHDKAYWCGGTKEERQSADLKLRTDGGTLMGIIMQAGVEIGGSPYFPFAWRWGYGWDYGRFYRK